METSDIPIRLLPDLRLAPDTHLIRQVFGEGVLPWSSAVFSLVAPEDVRWVNHGESWSAGDRVLTAFLPPVFDGPTTRGLFDSTSGVYWAADAFGAALPAVVDRASDVAPAEFAARFLDLQRLIAPWHRWLDERRFNEHVSALEAVEPSVIASGHGVALTGAAVPTAFSLLRGLPSAGMLALPNNVPNDDDLTMLVAAFEQAVAA